MLKTKVFYNPERELLFKVSEGGCIGKKAKATILELNCVLVDGFFYQIQHFSSKKEVFLEKSWILPKKFWKLVPLEKCEEKI